MKRTIVALSILIAPVSLAAHGSGLSWEQQVGEHTIDIGYEMPPQAGERLLLDFSLWADATKTDAEDFERVWVRMRIQDTTVLATGVGHASIGPTTLLYTIPESGAGEGELLVRFEKGDDVIAEATFPLTILPAEKKGIQQEIQLLTALLAGLAIGAFGYRLFTLRTTR